MPDRSSTSAYLLPSVYLPLREFFSAFQDAEKIIIDTDESWQKQTLRNRTYILGANGVQCLTVPVEHTGGIRKLIKEIKISYSEPWIRVHKGALFSAYNTSPFFTFFKDELFAIYDAKPSFLIDLNEQIFRLLLNKLKLKIDISPLSNQTEFIDLKKLADIEDLKKQKHELPAYHQVFSYKQPFCPYLSVIDILSNKGRL